MRIKKSLRNLKKAPHYRTSPISTRGRECGPNLWQQHHHKAGDALRSATKGDRGFTSIWDRWQNDEICRQSQLAHDGSDVWVRYLDHIAHFSIYHNATQQQRESHMNLFYSRSVAENRQAPPLSQRPGYWEAKKEWINPQKARREELAHFIPISERQRLQNKIDPSLQKNFEWLSTKWAEQFAEEHHQPSSSSSWSPSSTWWSASSWTPSWQRWHQHSWQDDKWSEQW